MIGFKHMSKAMPFALDVVLSHATNVSPHVRESGIHEILASGIRNPAHGNPGIRNPGLGIRNPVYNGIRGNPRFLKPKYSS